MGTPNNGINGTLGTGLIGHWDFDGGSILDVSGNNFSLEQGTSNLVKKDLDKDNIADNAILIDKLDSYYKAYPTSITNFESPCISVWVKPTSYKSPIVALNGTGALSQGFLLYFGWGASPYFSIFTNVGFGEIELKSSSTHSMNTWHHVVGSYNKTTGYIKLYVNKILVANSNIGTGGISYFSNETRIGSTGWSQFYGNIDEIRIYDRVLDDGNILKGEMATGEIAELYTMGVNYYITKCETPVTNLAGGTYTEAQTVELTCSTPDSAIYYTLDGSTPTISSLIYTSPIHIFSTTTLKAIAVADGIGDSDVLTETYTINYPLENITLEGFYQTKLRNEVTGEYVFILGKTDTVSTTFAHVKKYNIYGQLKQSQVAINKKTTLDIGYITEEDKNKVEKWWETKSTIWIEQDNKIPILCTFVDTDFALKEEYDTENDVFYYNGTLNFE